MLRKDSSKIPKRVKKIEIQKYKEQSVCIHKRSFLIITYPVIFLFLLIKSVLCYLFLLLKTFGKLVFDSTKFIYESQLHKNKSLTQNAVDIPVATEKMSTSNKYQPGPGDPLLVKQKQHHRRAFEYISKALKIDEENEGKQSIKLYILEPFLNEHLK